MAARYSDLEETGVAANGEAMPSERDILATIAETTDAFIQVADLDYRWLAINRASADEFERIFGVRPQVGMSMLDILADRPEHRDAVKAVWGRALAGEEFTEIGEFGDSERRFYEMKYNSYFDSEGNRVGAFQIVTDVTERVRAERKLAEAEAALRQSQKMEAIGQLTGGLAHDFNNLLQIVVGNLELIQNNLPAEHPKLKRYSENAMRGAARATDLAHRLLAFAKPSPGEQKVIDANSVVRGMRDIIRHAVGDQIDVQLSLLDEPAAIKADPNQLESAILNLVVNARDAMPEGGTIRISTSVGNGDDLPLAQRSKRGATAIVISVEDTGQGMDECALGHLFEPFFTTKEPGRGTGLGLAMVYSFVQLADGHIRVLSEPGRGSEFRLGFPQVTPDATIHSLIGQQSAPRSRSQQLVLVVQDDDDVRQHSAEIMRTLGYRVIEAHDSQAALSMLEKHLNDIALLFCDVGLANGASGHELAEQARLRQPLLKVLFTTGSADALADYQANGEPVIAKPFSTVQLALRMRETIDGSAAIAPRA